MRYNDPALSPDVLKHWPLEREVSPTVCDSDAPGEYGSVCTKHNELVHEYDMP